jgi:hypothetical protein
MQYSREGASTWKIIQQNGPRKQAFTTAAYVHLSLGRNRLRAPIPRNPLRSGAVLVAEVDSNSPGGLVAVVAASVPEGQAEIAEEEIGAFAGAVGMPRGNCLACK